LHEAVLDRLDGIGRGLAVAVERQVSGISPPFLAARRSFPPATTEVAMSSTIGSRARGERRRERLVAYVGVVPPNGGRIAGPLFIAIPMKPARAAIIV
jgi:hypothetical protein